MSVYVGLISIDDRPGLVHQITGVLFRHQLNVTENQEYVDHHAGRFFMRTQFEGAVDLPGLQRDLKSVVPEATLCQVRELKPRRVVALASREPHCLGELLLRYSTNDMDMQLLSVVSQHEDCRELTERFKVPFHHVPVKGADRAQHEAAVLKVLEPYRPDYLVLARYMRVFTKDFIAHFPERVVNIHHSFLPAFIGRDPYHQAYERGVKIIGATSHFVTEQLDEGPIVTQDVIPVDHTCSAERMAKMGQDVEKLVLVRGLKLILEDRVLIEGNRTIVFQ